MRNREKTCPCKKIKCERHGNCVACREYHATIEKRYLPACERKKSCVNNKRT